MFYCKKVYSVDRVNASYGSYMAGQKLLPKGCLMNCVGWFSFQVGKLENHSKFKTKVLGSILGLETFPFSWKIFNLCDNFTNQYNCVKILKCKYLMCSMYLIKHSVYVKW